VADLAEALNRLAGALAVSENRQREFLLSVSHELRTPLTGVKGYAEALADGVVTGDDVPRTGAVMLSEAERLERLVSDLLDLSRAGAADLRLDLRPVDLVALAEQAGTVWSDRCQREGVQFRLEVPGAPVVAVTDPLRVRQIVDNLAENALRVTPSGAPVVLAVAAEPGPPPQAVVQLRDGGPGLTADDVEVAFQPAALFARYRGVRRVGTGVGLALVGRLAARLGGTAQAGRAPEGGACFTVRLPLSVAAATPAPPPAATPPAAPHDPAAPLDPAAPHDPALPYPELTYPELTYEPPVGGTATAPRPPAVYATERSPWERPADAAGSPPPPG
jgi:two-component system sensor histidine kinase BaeS